MGQEGMHAGDLERHGKLVPINIFLEDIAADSDAIKHCIWNGGVPLKIVNISVSGTVTKQDTNYNKIAVTVGESVSSTNDITSWSTGPNDATGQTLTVGVPVLGTLDEDYTEVASTEKLFVEFTKEGNGQAITGLAIHVLAYVNL